MLLKILGAPENLMNGIPFGRLPHFQFEVQNKTDEGYSEPVIMSYSSLKTRLQDPEPVSVRCHNGACQGVYAPKTPEASKIAFGQRMFNLDIGAAERDAMILSGAIKAGPSPAAVRLLCGGCVASIRKEEQRAQKEAAVEKRKRVAFAQAHRCELLFNLAFWAGVRNLAAKSSEKRCLEYLKEMDRICSSRTGIMAEDTGVELKHNHLDKIVDVMESAVNEEAGLEKLATSIKLGIIVYNPVSKENDQEDAQKKIVRPDRWWHAKKKLFVKHRLLGTDERARVRHRGKNIPHSSTY
jgi:hypothetical protein